MKKYLLGPWFRDEWKMCLTQFMLRNIFWPCSRPHDSSVKSVDSNPITQWHSFEISAVLKLFMVSYLDFSDSPCSFIYAILIITLWHFTFWQSPAKSIVWKQLTVPAFVETTMIFNISKKWTSPYFSILNIIGDIYSIQNPYCFSNNLLICKFKTVSTSLCRKWVRIKWTPYCVVNSDGQWRGSWG